MISDIQIEKTCVSCVFPTFSGLALAKTVFSLCFFVFSAREEKSKDLKQRPGNVRRDTPVAMLAQVVLCAVAI